MLIFSVQILCFRLVFLQKNYVRRNICTTCIAERRDTRNRKLLFRHLQRGENFKLFTHFSIAHIYVKRERRKCAIKSNCPTNCARKYIRHIVTYCIRYIRWMREREIKNLRGWDVESVDAKKEVRENSSGTASGGNEGRGQIRVRRGLRRAMSANGRED